MGLVTGAFGGLGQAMAIGLAEAGVVIIAVSFSESIQTVNKALSFYGRIDILVNNAGTIRLTPAANHASKDWHDLMSLNLNSLFFLSQLVGRQMIEQGSGKIINIASMLTYQGGINVPGYIPQVNMLLLGWPRHLLMSGRPKAFK
jgi:2-deoxy-D-gluconate 3-dehydrogenase